MAHLWLGGSYLLTSTSTTLQPALCRCRHMCSPLVLLAPVSGHREVSVTLSDISKATPSNLDEAFGAKFNRLPKLPAVWAQMSRNGFSAGCPQSIPAEDLTC